MQKGALEQVEEALGAVYAPTTNNAVRAKAQAVCDAFAARQEAAREGLMLYAVATREGKSDALRLFALSACQRALRAHWSQLGDDDKEQVKGGALELLESGTRGADVEPRFILNKVVSLVVDLAKREFPQRWPNFLGRMLETAQRGMSQATLVMGVLRDLADDCTNSEFNAALPPRRRAEILTELRGAQAELVPLCYRLLETCFGQIASDAGAAKQAAALAEATLATLAAMTDICPLQTLLESNVVAAIGEFTRQLGRGNEATMLQMTAWRCIAVFAAKTVPERSTIDVGLWTSSLVQACSRAMLSFPARSPSATPGTIEAVWPTFAIGNDPGAAELAAELIGGYDVHREMGRAISSLAVAFLEQLVNEANRLPGAEARNARALEALRGILDALVRFLGHANPLVRSSVMPGVTAFARVLTTSGAAVRGQGDLVVAQALEMVLRGLADHVIRLGHPDSPEEAGWPSAAFAIEFYDDVAEFEEAHSNQSTIAKTIIKTIAQRRCVETLHFFRLRAEIACGAVARPPLVQNGAALAVGQLAPQQPAGELAGPREAYLKATLVHLPDAIGPALPKGIFAAFGAPGAEVSAASYAAAAAELRKALELVLAYNPIQPREWTCCVHTLSRLSACFGAPPDGPNLWLGPALEKLFACATFRTPEEVQRAAQGSALSAATLAARKRGCTALVEICSQLSAGSSSPEIRAKLASLLPTFCNQVLLAMNSDANALLPYEKLMLYEVLVLVSNTLEDPAAQAGFVQDIVASPLAEWSSPSLKELCTDPRRVAAALREAPALRTRALVDAKRSLSLVLSIGRKCKSVQGRPRPFAQYWAQVLPNVLAMIKVLHYFWKEPSGFEDLLFVHPEELRCLIGSAARKNARPGTSPHQAQQQHQQLNQPVEATATGAPASQSFTLWMDPVAPPATEDEAMWFVLHLVSGLREGLYSALGAAARYGDAGLFGMEDALRGVQDVVLADLEALEHRHLARILQAVVVPLINSCPPRLWHNYLFPVLVRVFGHTFQRLKLAWAVLPTLHDSPAQGGSGQRADAGSMAAGRPEWQPRVRKALESADEDDANVEQCTSGRCGHCLRCQQTEMARDASVRLLSVSLVDAVSAVLNCNLPDGCKDMRDEVPTEMCIQALRSDELAHATLVSLVGTIACPDSASMNKAVILARRIFHCCLLAEPRFHNFVVNQLFCACFSTVFGPKMAVQDAAVQGLLQIITDIWCFALQGGAELPNETSAVVLNEASPYRQMVRQHLLQGVPNLPISEVVAAEETLCLATTGKTRRNRVKEFVQTCLCGQGAEGEIAAGLQARQVADLPLQPSKPGADKSFQRNQGSWASAADAWDLGVQALFDPSGGGL